MVGTTSVSRILSVYSKVIQKLITHKVRMTKRKKEIEVEEAKLLKIKVFCNSEVGKAEKAIEGFRALVGELN